MELKKGFTLLELVVVIIILGVLATLGITQYGSMVERSRDAEAKTVLGDMRKLAVAYWLQNGSVTGMTMTDLNIGPGADQIPGPDTCRGTHYFYYWANADSGPNHMNFVAYRCASGGKPPQGQGRYVLLWTNFVNGIEGWSTCVAPGDCQAPAGW